MLRWMKTIGVMGLLVLVVLAAVPGMQVLAQGSGNLLANPGFEGFYRSYNYNEANRGLVLEFRIADGWNPWFRENGPNDEEWQYRRPEYRPGTYSYNGTQSQQFFASFGTHEAGLMQRVEGVTPGQTYQFSIAAYIWSSMGGNFYLSEQPGDAVVRVGIDPTGGTNPWARSVVWSPFQSFYDQWRVLTVDAVAQSSALTVFFWSHQQYPVIHNDVAVDEAYLGPADGAPVAPAAAPAVEVAPPVVESPAPVSPVSPTGVTMTASIDLRLRAGLYGQVLDVIPAGTPVSVLGRTGDDNWVQVTYNGQQGWTASWYGVYSSPFADLPVVAMP
jgi:hypothetical protein